MLRPLFALLLFTSTQFHCQEIEINDDEPSPPFSATPIDEASAKEDDFFKGSPDVNFILSFVNPPLGQLESSRSISLAAGKPASFIVSLENTQSSSTSYGLHTLEAALHYPRYFGYHIQNFTTQRLQNILQPGEQASLYYTFVPAMQLAGQQFDLAVILTYRGQTDKPYFHSLFNETISFIEDAEGMDVELIFLGVMIVGICVLAVVFAWHWITNKASRRPHSGKSVAALNDTDVLKSKKNTTDKLVNQPSPTNGNASSKGNHRQGKK